MGARLSALLAGLPPELDATVVQDGRRVIVAVAPDLVVAASGEETFAQLDRLPGGWWAGFLTYDLGRAVERVRPRRAPPTPFPDLLFARYPARLVLDPTSGTYELRGSGEGRALLERAAGYGAGPVAMDASAPSHRWRSSLDRAAYEAGVAVVLEAIGAGDCYQVNLCRRLTSDRPHDPVALLAALDEHNPAPHAAYVRTHANPRCPAVTVVSASPERFLAWRGRDVETRPIKGTDRDPHRLARSAKDRAENVMIVDLARNDLGRVCEPGSISVPALCAVEEHPGLHHLVSTVRGRRRVGSTLGDLVRATFPPASVTGAPKPRVMQIIEDLEPVRRGIYCGAVGWIDTERDEGDLNVAIRTFTVTDDETQLGVGSGIVADSDPAREWDETELKAARLLATADVGATPTGGARTADRETDAAPTLVRPA